MLTLRPFSPMTDGNVTNVPARQIAKMKRNDFVPVRTYKQCCAATARTPFLAPT
jgi:hypothetical protein